MASTSRGFVCSSPRSNATCCARGESDKAGGTFLEWVNAWVILTAVLNDTAQSMGQPPLYPFVLNKAAVTKLHFIQCVMDQGAAHGRVPPLKSAHRVLAPTARVTPIPAPHGDPASPRILSGTTCLTRFPSPGSCSQRLGWFFCRWRRVSFWGVEGNAPTRSPCPAQWPERPWGCLPSCWHSPSIAPRLGIRPGRPWLLTRRTRSIWPGSVPDSSPTRSREDARTSSGLRQRAGESGDRRPGIDGGVEAVRRIARSHVAGSRRGHPSRAQLHCDRLFVQSLNEVLDLHVKRLTVGVRNRVPGTIWLTLYLLMVLAMSMMGIQIGHSRARRVGLEIGTRPVICDRSVRDRRSRSAAGGSGHRQSQAMLDLQARLSATLARVLVIRVTVRSRWTRSSAPTRPESAGSGSFQWTIRPHRRIAAPGAAAASVPVTSTSWPTWRVSSDPRPSSR